MNDEKNQREQEHGPEVEVVDLKTNAEVRFRALWSDTLKSLWDRAYSELKEARRDGDTLECQDGTVLTQYLTNTLEELRDKKICHGRKLQIKGPTGGAWRR
jgi:hypothetical protein